LSHYIAKRDRGGGALPPQAPQGGEKARRAFTLLSVATLLCAPALALPAQADSGAPARPPGQAESASHFLALTVLGSAVRAEGEWDSAFGGEVAVGALRAGDALAAWAAGIDFVAYSERSGGRVTLEGALGTRWPTGVLLGLAGGPMIELDDFRRPRAGGQLSVWIFAGVVPYVRAGTVEDSGFFVDLGLRIPLPVLRW
jgi:hypothetical protein